MYNHLESSIIFYRKNFYK